MFEILGFEILGKIYSDLEMCVNFNIWFVCGVFYVIEDVKI